MAKLGRWAAIGGGVLAFASAAGAFMVYREKRAEMPDYRVVESDDDCEVRDYAALVVAETTDTGDRDGALSKGFRRLGDYISGKNRRDTGGEKIEMTAPVLTDRAPAGRWRTRFFMPARFAAGALPTPGDRVEVATLPARRVAAIRFSGGMDDDTLADRERTLRQWLAARGLKPTAPAEYAFYNSPFVPSPVRRSEVLIPVSR